VYCPAFITGDEPVSMKHLLIVYHSQTGNTAGMAEAVKKGATGPDTLVEVRFKRAGEAGADDLLWCDGLLIGTPENFGYMSGALKDFLDRTFYPLEGKIQALPYAIFISAGNDGSGALTSIRRIGNGYPFKEVMEPVIAQGDVTETHLAKCQEMGMTMAAGLEAGIF
jgi:multimeric flavodoxin WrbA